jgi:hypothetical protein
MLAIIQPDSKKGGLQKKSAELNRLFKNSIIINYNDLMPAKNKFANKIFANIIRLLKIIIALKKNGTKTAIINGTDILWLGSILSLLRIQVVLRETSDPRMFRRISKAKDCLNRISRNCCNKIVAQTPLMRRQIIFRQSHLNKKVTIIENYADWRGNLRAILEPGIPIKFLFLGTLDKNKDPCSCIKFIKKNLKDEQYTIDFVGSGPELEKLKGLYNSHNVKFKGEIDSRSIFIYGAYHFLIVTSKYEASPNNIREAASCCIPTLYSASCKGGTKDIGKKVGLKVNFDTEQGDLYDKIIRFKVSENDFMSAAGSKDIFNSKWKEIIKYE